MTPDLLLAVYRESRCLERTTATPGDGEVDLRLRDHRLRVRAESDARGNWTLRGRVEETGSDPIAAGVELAISPWSPSRFLFAPAAVYEGNRFHVSSGQSYPPRHPAGRAGLDSDIVIADVPHLERGPGPSSLRLLSGDMAAPAFGWFDAERRDAWLVLAPSHSDWGELGWEFVEAEDRSSARLRITTPGVRETAYHFPELVSDGPSPDRGRDSGAGDAFTLRLRIRRTSCADRRAFFRWVHAEIRSYWPDHPLDPHIPFSAAAAVVEDKNNREAWREDLGLYLTSSKPGTKYPYQNGWVGGLINTLPLLASGHPDSWKRAARNLDTVFTEGMAEGPLPYARCTAEGVWESEFASDTRHPHSRDWTLTRRHADVLYYGLKHILLLRKRGDSIPASWNTGLRGLADHFVRLASSPGRFGEFLHQHTGETALGGTAGGALVPAGLMLAARVWDVPAYTEAAEQSAEHLETAFLARGFANGGPGDIIQAPDSEAAYALVESFALLADATGDVRWTSAAEDAAAQFATWVMPYNYAFPPDSEFARLGMQSRGTVFANIQNKHSAPGICTHAGTGLLRLYRRTGDRTWLDLLRDIARTLPQYLSREDRPIRCKDGTLSRPGWINERVNTSDWDHKKGDIFSGPCWCEVSLSLTALELPGIVARPDTGDLAVLDHVEAQWLPDRAGLRIHNPTPFDASVRLLCETRAEQSRPLPPLFALDLPAVDVPANGENRYLLHLNGRFEGEVKVQHHWEPKAD